MSKVMSGRSVNLSTLFPGRLRPVNQYFVHILSPVTDNCPSWISGRWNESMWPDRVSNPGPLTYESGALSTALRGPAGKMWKWTFSCRFSTCVCNKSPKYWKGPLKAQRGDDFAKYALSIITEHVQRMKNSYVQNPVKDLVWFGPYLAPY